MILVLRYFETSHLRLFDYLFSCGTWQPGPDAVGIIAISHGCVGIAARACGLVALDASKVTEILKDRPAWLQDCRRMDVLGALPTGTGGTIELLYTQVLDCSF